MPIRVVIADNHPITRAGLQGVLGSAPDVLVAGMVATGAEALQAIAQHRPDVLILDLLLPDCSGLTILRRLSQQEGRPKTLVYSILDDAKSILAALTIGAAGYVRKDDPSTSLVEAVRGIARGQVGWLSPAVAARLLPMRIAMHRASPSTDSLSPREAQVLAMVAAGIDNADIASSLGVAEGTVKNYVHRVYSKLGVRGRSAAMRWAWQHGFAPAPEDPSRGALSPVEA